MDGGRLPGRGRRRLATFRATRGIMDEMGGVKTIGYSWQTTWGAPKTTAPPTGTGATKVVVTADHPTLLTDLNDVSFFQAAIANASGATVSSTTPVTSPSPAPAPSSPSTAQA